MTHCSISKLLAIASDPIADPTNATDALSKWGRVGQELADMLNLINGFYAYESALFVRPLHNAVPPLGLLEWNARDCWVTNYPDDLSDVLFFAEDVFGGQYCIRKGSICTFNPETGVFEEMNTSLDAWANDVITDHNFRTGFSLAHSWQVQNAPLQPGRRLIPKVPFVLGGKYEVNNLHSLDEVNGMLFRASIANQIRDLPDGAEIVLKTNYDV
jgi:hypothetical protein